MRKRDENDFFLNQGGTFTNGSDLAQADNGNKGGNGLWDLDNDGDLDAVWTENGYNQIFRNDGPGVWTPLGTGTFPGLPQPTNANNGSSSNDIDALAGGDIDNDGCGDADEAYGDVNSDVDDNGMYGSANPPVNNDGTVTAASYSTPEDANSNTIFDFQVIGKDPSIITHPLDITLCPGCSGILSVNALNSDTYQWQVFNGSTWTNLTNSGIYSGVDTNTLVLTEVTPAEHENRYRVLVSSSTFICNNVISNVADLTINVPTVITNRRITYRIKKN